MIHRLFALIFCTCVLASCSTPSGNTDDAMATETDTTTAMAAEQVSVHPIFHAAVVLTKGDRTIFVDPYGGAERFEGFAAPDLVLITHTHGDHLDTSTLSGLDLSQATLIAPRAVVDALTDNPFAETHALANGENYDWEDITVSALAAYNPPPKDNMHPEGKFNGYVIDFDGERYYFSGDTEDVAEMRALKDIEVAFVCMNLPYTMTVDSAASAVLEFAPSIVYPYHYRNQDESKSDIERFKQLVGAGNPSIDVRLQDWYTK